MTVTELLVTILFLYALPGYPGMPPMLAPPGALGMPGQINSSAPGQVNPSMPGQVNNGTPRPMRMNP